MSVSLMLPRCGMSATPMRRDQSLCHFPHIPPPRGIRLVTLPPHACPYLPGREATYRATAAERIEPEFYHAFMDAGFRRSGTMVYQPVCIGCRECRQLRVPTATFVATKSQRRSMRRNSDVVVNVGRPEPTQEKFNLYSRYVAEWHRREESETPEDFVRFLYDSPVDTLEFTYRVGERLLGVGICDRSAMSLSSVYFYFDPADAGRSLGTYSVIREIEYARDQHLPHWYAGFWVRDCPAMAYKSNFGPAEVLGMDGQWRPLPADARG